jgi:glycosyltransferase involved in cell wall biosynthesis
MAGCEGDKREVGTGSIWITWSRHRRTEELAPAFGAKLCVVEGGKGRLTRYVRLSAATLWILLRTRPSTVFVQNPSILLATLVCIVRRPFNLCVVVDRHSNFKQRTFGSRRIALRLFHFLSRYTVKKADLTIVTTPFLCDLVRRWGGRGVILQDKFPTMGLGGLRCLTGAKNIVSICSFSGDEPVDAVIKAAKLINPDWHVYITGDSRKFMSKQYLYESPPRNVTLTGFLSDSDYQTLLRSANLLLVLTTAEELLTCGAYEGISLGKPLVLSDTEAIKAYFSEGVLYCQPNGESIAAAIETAFSNEERFASGVKKLRERLETNWQRRFERLRSRVDGPECRRR